MTDGNSIIALYLIINGFAILYVIADIYCEKKEKEKESSQSGYPYEETVDKFFNGRWARFLRYFQRNSK